MSEKTIEALIFWGKALLTVVIGLLSIKIIDTILKHALKRTHLDAAVHKFIRSSLKILLLIALIVAALSYMGVPAAPFITIIGAGGAAIAIALRDSLANIAGGIMILVTKPFKYGDFVTLGENEGFVQSIDITNTRLLTRDNKLIIAPNGIVNSSILVNHSKEKTRRVDCKFSISYYEDTVYAKEVLLETVKNNSDILNTPKPYIGVTNHSDHGVEIDVFVWCNTDVYWDVKSYMEETAKTALQNADITMAVPRMLVHIDKRSAD